MNLEEYKEFKEKAVLAIANILGDAMQEIEDYAVDILEQNNFLDEDNEDDYRKADQWTGLLIWEIVNGWNDTHEDPYLPK